MAVPQVSDFTRIDPAAKDGHSYRPTSHPSERDGIPLSGFAAHQPILADTDGNMQPDLLGLGQTESGSSLQFWQQKGDAFER
jgi:hypothetical protein